MRTTLFLKFESLIPSTPTASHGRQRLSAHGLFERQTFLLRGTLEEEFDEEGKPIGLTVFSDGRVFVHGTLTAARARAINNRWLGG